MQLVHWMQAELVRLSIRVRSTARARPWGPSSGSTRMPEVVLVTKASSVSSLVRVRPIMGPPLTTQYRWVKGPPASSRQARKEVPTGTLRTTGWATSPVTVRIFWVKGIPSMAWEMA